MQFLCTPNENNFSSKYSPPQTTLLLGDTKRGLGTLKNNALMIFKQHTMFDLLGWFLHCKNKNIVLFIYRIPECKWGYKSKLLASYLFLKSSFFSYDKTKLCQIVIFILKTDKLFSGAFGYSTEQWWRRRFTLIKTTTSYYTNC